MAAGEGTWENDDYRLVLRWDEAWRLVAPGGSDGMDVGGIVAVSAWKAQGLPGSPDSAEVFLEVGWVTLLYRGAR